MKLAGKKLPVFNPEFKNDSTRTTYMLIDRGNIPTGDTREQISKSKEQNFDPKNILNQSIMRYNQLYSVKTTITIPGDFSLHAGDIIFIDNPSIDQNEDELDKQFGGIYMVADLCHYISAKETFTKLNLVRDSFGRIGNHSPGSVL